MIIRKKHPPVGSRPGTLAIDDDALPTTISVFRYTASECEVEKVNDLNILTSILQRGGVSWIDVQGFGSEGKLRQLAELLGLHVLVLEDAVNVPQRAKSELFSNHHLFIARIPILGEEGALSVPQVAILITKQYIVTFQERHLGAFAPVRQRIEAGIGPIRTQGPDYLAYVLLDTLVDHYYPVLETLSAQLEDLEEEVMGNPGPECLASIHQLRRQLVVLRRVTFPQRTAIHDLLKTESPFITAENRSYLRDTHDHISQIAELVDSGRDMTMALMDIYLSNVSQRTNEIMKVLTLMASIFIPLTFLAGIYGMNFEHMPELSRKEAYPLLLAMMLMVAAAMVVYFKRRGWLGRGPRKKSLRIGE